MPTIFGAGAYSQQAQISNPFQDTNNKQQGAQQTDRQPKADQTQPTGAAASGTEKTQSENQNKQNVQLASSGDNESQSSQRTGERGSVLDISV